VIDVHAWESKPGPKPVWFELNFRKDLPKFSKIGIYGSYSGEPKVRIWKAGEWKNLTPKNVERTKYAAVLDFGEELRSVKIRIDFAKQPRHRKIELYEIELLK